jgi:PBP1b-binding outer membrane lipoprotein LpoB
MKMKLFTFLFTISAIFITGCSNTYDSETIYDDSTIEEISAVRKMNFESNKTDAYTRIASRTDLSDEKTGQTVL